MNIAGMHPQIWISFIVILAAGGVALLVDYLRGKNQQLREAMVELELRREQDGHKITYKRMNAASKMTGDRAARLAGTPDKAVEQRPDPLASAITKAEAKMDAEHRAPASTPAEPPRERSIESRVSEARNRNLAIRELQDPAVEFTSTRGRRRNMNNVPESLPRLEDLNPREALSDWLNKRAAIRPPTCTPAPVPETSGPETSEPETTENATPVVETPATPQIALVVETPAAETPAVPEAAAVEPVETVPAEPQVIEPEVVSEPDQPVLIAEVPEKTASPDPSTASVFIDESLWESILSQGRAKKHQRTVAEEAATVSKLPELRFEVIQGAGSRSHELRIPAGMHDQETLNQLLESNKPFTGLVVSLSANQNDGRAVEQEIMLSVDQFLRELLRENDFACRTNDDTFLLLCPGEQGGEAKARLTEISERLWDFQLRGITSFSILFSWGDVQVVNESLSEAVASAAERMLQTRRARKTISLETTTTRRKAAV